MRRLLTGLLAALSLALPATAGAATLTDLGDFDQPLYVAAPPGDGARLMVVQKQGEIRVLVGATHSLFLNVATAPGGGGVATAGEQGLLSMAFAPDYAATGRFFVYYTAADGASNRVDEFTVSADPSVADQMSRRPVISIPHPNPQTNHNGGQIAFGPDGMLYIAPGDGAADSGQAQLKTSLLGKVLRIDPRSGATYTIPPGNPYTAPGDDGADEVFHLGLRNPFRFSFDRASGDLIIGDVGASETEEVTLVPSGTAAGRNFGWPKCEGTSCSEPPPPDYIAPALQYSRTSSQAVTGGVVVRDPTLPDLNACYIYADFFEGAIRTATLSAGAGAGHGVETGLSTSNLASFSEDNANRVYVTSLFGNNVFRIEPGGTQAPRCPARPVDPVPTGGGGDTTAPRLLTRTPRSQRVLRQKGVVAYTRCSNESCNLSMTARLRIGRLSYPLQRVRRTLAANRRVKVRAKLPSRASRALRRALRLRKSARVDVAYRARDGAGNRSPLKRTKVRVRR